MKLFFDDDDLDGQLQRTAAAALCGAADLGEILVAASRIAPGDPTSWFESWSSLAIHAESLAAESAARNHGVSTAGAWLRACEYWRQAFFYLRHDIADRHLLEAWRRHRAAFRAALPLLECAALAAEIPFAGAGMTAYLLRPAGPARSRPTVILPAGFDSTAEAGYAATGWMALSHGMNALIWEGPGQGGMLYQSGIAMRPDFETVLPPVIDWLLAQNGIDSKSLVLVGRSFAGYLAPRAAAHEKRLAALVCDPGQYDFVPRFVPAMIDEATWQKVLARDPATDAALERMLEAPGKRQWLGPRMATQGAKTVGDFMRLQPLYTLEGHARLIACPTLIVDCAGDFASQGDKLYGALTCPRKLVKLDVQSGAGGHCGGLGQRVWERIVFDWIAETLG